MATRKIAQGLASLGRNGDSMLVHMQPSEVAGLQTLARNHGTTLTINPHTGLPEAFNLRRAIGSFAKAALPVAAGFALGPGGMALFDSALTTGLAVGAGAYGITKDPAYALSAGLGAAGGAGTGENVAAYGNKIANAGTAPITTAPITTAPVTTAASGTNLLQTPELDNILKANVGSVPTAQAAQTLPFQGGFDNQLAGIKGIFGSTPKGVPSYGDFLKGGYQNAAGDIVKPSLWKDIATVGMPLMSIGQPQPVGPKEEKDVYDGPYLPVERQVNMPTAEQTEQLRLAGSPEFNYFTPSNPVPGYRTFAQGGTIQTGGIRDLYGTQDDQTNGVVLSQDGYGLGRLQHMYGGGMAGYADGGQIANVPNIPNTPNVPNMPSVASVPQMGQPQPQAQQGFAGINSLLGQAVRDPLGRAMAKGGYLDGPGDGMSDSIPATIEGKQPARLADGEFVVPADVVSHLGNGSTKAGAKHLYKMMDRVRQARTGTKKQGRQINPSKLMPA